MLFVSQLPDIEIKEIPGEKLKFELHQKDPSRIFILAAHKETVKDNWLAEIEQHIADAGNCLFFTIIFSLFNYKLWQLMGNLFLTCLTFSLIDNFFDSVY